MLAIYKERMKNAFGLYEELASFIDEASFRSKLADLPSNTIGQQLWCVVGARESYIAGIQKGAWSGFSCSLPFESAGAKEEVCGALRRSAETAQEVLKELAEPTEAQARLAFELLEHEIKHHGQLIRYLYGLKLGIPKGWKERYHLD